MANGLPDNALFVCFGGMSNVGTLTGLAGMEAVKRAGPGKAAIFCLGVRAVNGPMTVRTSSCNHRSAPEKFVPKSSGIANRPLVTATTNCAGLLAASCAPLLRAFQSVGWNSAVPL